MTSDRSLRAGRMGHRIAPLGPGTIGDPGGTGTDNRLFLEALLGRVRTGGPGRDLPARFGPPVGCTEGNAVVKRVRRGVKAGVFATIVRAVSAAFDRESAGIAGTRVTAHATAAGAPSGARTLGGPTPRPAAAPGAAGPARASP